MEVTAVEAPTLEQIDSDFQVLDTDYADEEFFGGAFEGSHVYGDLIVLRLYSIVADGSSDVLRVETRYHYLGDVLEHERSDRDLDADRTLPDDDRDLAVVCREHHFRDPVGEMESLLAARADGRRETGAPEQPSTTSLGGDTAQDQGW